MPSRHSDTPPWLHQGEEADQVSQGEFAEAFDALETLLASIQRKSYFATFTVPTPMADLPPYPGMPVWAKVFAVITVLAILLFVILLFTRGPGGHHGPAQRTTSDEVGVQGAPSNMELRDRRSR